MMRFMNDPATGRCALYEPAGSMGDPDDPNSPQNGPLNNPAAHLARIRVHTDFDYYQVHSITSVSITHAAVAGASVLVASSPSITRVGQVVRTNIDLVNHGLGYPPRYMIVSGDGLIGQSSLIQIGGTGGRRISPFATASHIKLLDVGISSAAALAAISRTYKVIVFRAPTADSSYLFDWDPISGALILGKGKFRGSLQALRRTLDADASPFDIPLGRTSDIANGVSRTVLADGTTFTSPNYTGSFTGSPSLECTVE